MRARDLQPKSSTLLRPARFEDAANGRVDLGEFLDREVYPRLFERADSAFPEFGWVRQGSNWVATAWPTGFPFPVQHERPDRLMLYADRPWWIKVHGHGGVRLLDLVNGGRHPRGEEFLEAVKKLADCAGVKVPERVLSPEAAAAARKRDARRAILAAAALHCRHILWGEGGSGARAYLAGRGLSDDTLREFGLGLYPGRDEVRRFLADGGFQPRDIRDSAAAWAGMEGYVTCPWADAYGHPLTLYGRWPAKDPPDGKPKTTALPGAGSKGSPLYFDRVRRSGHKHVVLVEGVLDALTLQAMGDTRVVACVAAQLSGEQVETLRRHRIDAVTICLDPDEGGDRGIGSCIESLSRAGISAYVAPRLPDGLDPDEFALREGIEGWRAHIAGAVSGAVFLAGRALGDVTPASPDPERRAAVERARAVLAGLGGPHAALDREDVLRLAAERTGYSSEAAAEGLHGEAPEESSPSSSYSVSDGDDSEEHGAAARVVTLSRLRELYSGAVEWHVEGYVALRELTEVVGPPESLKSWAMADLARATLTGDAWLGHCPVPQGAVLYVEQERANNLVYQMTLLERGIGCDLDGLLVLPPGGFALTDPSGRALLAGLVAEHRPRLVIVNSFRSVFRGRAADGVEVAAAVGWLGRLAERRGFAAVLVDQTNKAGGTGHLRGMAAHADSLQKEYEADAILHVERDRDEVGRGIGPARLYVGKRRAGEAGPPFNFELRERGDGVAPVRLEEIAIGRAAASPETALAKVRAALEITAGPTTAEALAEATGLGVGTVKNKLTELKKAGGAGQPEYGLWEVSSPSPTLSGGDGDDGRAASCIDCGRPLTWAERPARECSSCADRRERGEL